MPSDVPVGAEVASDSSFANPMAPSEQVLPEVDTVYCYLLNWWMEALILKKVADYCGCIQYSMSSCIPISKDYNVLSEKLISHWTN